MPGGRLTEEQRWGKWEVAVGVGWDGGAEWRAGGVSVQGSGLQRGRGRLPWSATIEEQFPKVSCPFGNTGRRKGGGRGG